MGRGNQTSLVPSKDDPYPVIKQANPLLVDSFLNLPNCLVWIHEKALYKVIKLPPGAAFGQRHSLICLMKGIKRGYCGNMKGDHMVLWLAVPNFSHEKNDHRVSWQDNRRKKPFSNWNLMHATNARPW